MVGGHGCCMIALVVMITILIVCMCSPTPYMCAPEGFTSSGTRVKSPKVEGFGGRSMKASHYLRQQTNPYGWATSQPNIHPYEVPKSIATRMSHRVYDAWSTRNPDFDMGIYNPPNTRA